MFSLQYLNLFVRLHKARNADFQVDLVAGACGRSSWRRERIVQFSGSSSVFFGNRPRKSKRIRVVSAGLAISLSSQQTAAQLPARRFGNHGLLFRDRPES